MILYYLYRQFLSNKAAFLSAFFFAIVPTFFMEITAISRQQIATLFFAVMLYVILSKNEGLPLKLRVPIIVCAGMLAIVSHYTTGALVMMFLSASVVIVAILKLRKLPLELPWRVLAVSAGAVIAGGLAYYGTVSGGTALHDLIGLLPRGAELQAMLPQLSAEIAPPQLPPGTAIPASGPGPIAGSPGITEILKGYSPLMQTALGLDFLSVSVWGKLFRIFQFLTQIGLGVGVLYLFRRAWKRQNGAIYTSMLAAACLLLMMCIIRPGFSAIINASRFYHYALIFAAPAIILSAQLLASKLPVLKRTAAGYSLIFAAVAIPYGLFTTGVVFEATQQPGITRFDMPYNTALSSHRLDLWGNYTQDDEIVREYITKSGDNPILTDIHGRVFLQETLGYTKSIYLLPRDFENIPDEYHIFLRSANAETQTLAHWTGPGLKEFVPAALPGDFKGRSVLFQSGNSYFLSEGSK